MSRRKARRPSPEYGVSWHTVKSLQWHHFEPLFLPPYSPDFNPIELCFAKLKAILRAARARTFDELCAVIALSLPRFRSDECAAYFRHCGYRAAVRS